MQVSRSNYQTFKPAPSPSPASNQPRTEALTGSLGGSISNANGQDVVQAVTRYKNDFIDSMPDKAKAESLVTAAINRTLGVSNPKDTTAEAEDPQEKAIMSEIAAMLNDLSKKHIGAQRRASDGIAPPSKPSPTPTDNDAASSLPAAASRAGKIAVQSPFANGDAYARNSTVERDAAEDKGSGKRPFGNRDSDEGNDHDQPESKRVAVEA